MTVRRGDVVIIDFPQAPGQQPKRRPAIVVQADTNNARLTNSIFAMVTSNTRLVDREPTQVLVDPSQHEGRSTGLVQRSAIKCENLYTLPQRLVLRTIGTLSVPLLQRLERSLKASLDVT